MNKTDIVKELDEYVKDIDLFFGVDSDDGDLNLRIKDSIIGYFQKFNVDKFYIATCSREESVMIIESSIIKKFYDKAVEILKKNEKKYTIQILGGRFGYLNFYKEENIYMIDDISVSKGFKHKFTQSEIKALKQRDDIAIDWNKAIIEEVK